MIDFMVDCVSTSVKGVLGIFIIIGGISVGDLFLTWIDNLWEKGQKKKKLKF